jgi:hypothetical protein
MAYPQRTRDKAIEAFLLGYSVGEAVNYSGVSRRTLVRWLNQDEAFRTQLDDARQRLFERHIAALADLTGYGIQRLRQILQNDEGPPRDWLKATELVMNQNRASEGAEIRKRMDEIERLLQERDSHVHNTDATGSQGA